MLASHPSLRHLGLSHCRISEGLDDLGSAVGKSTSLQTLSLQNVGFDEVEADTVELFVRNIAASSTLATLDVAGNPAVVPAHGVPLVSMLARALGSPATGLFTTLVDLRLQNSGIGDTHVEQVASQLLQAGAGSALRHLNLANNHFGAAGAAALGELLRFTSFLASLDVSGNDLHDTGVMGLAGALPLNDSLTHLMLADTGLSGRVAQVLADCILASPTLEVVALSGNHFCSTRDGAQHVARLVNPRQGRLRELHLQGHDAYNATAYGMSSQHCVGPTGVQHIIRRLRDRDNRVRPWPCAADTATHASALPDGLAETGLPDGDLEFRPLQLLDLRSNGPPPPGERWQPGEVLTIQGCEVHL